MKPGPPVQYEGCGPNSSAPEALLSQFYAVSPVVFNSVRSSCDCLAHRFGNAADRPDRVPAYGLDMTDAQWAVVRDALPVPAWMEGRGGQPEGYCHRQMLDQCHVVKGELAVSRVR